MNLNDFTPQQRKVIKQSIQLISMEEDLENSKPKDVITQYVDFCGQILCNLGADVYDPEMKNKLEQYLQNSQYEKISKLKMCGTKAAIHDAFKIIDQQDIIIIAKEISKTENSGLKGFKM